MGLYLFTMCGTLSLHYKITKHCCLFYNMLYKNSTIRYNRGVHLKNAFGKDKFKSKILTQTESSHNSNNNWIWTCNKPVPGCWVADFVKAPYGGAWMSLTVSDWIWTVPVASLGDAQLAIGWPRYGRVQLEVHISSQSSDSCWSIQCPWTTCQSHIWDVFLWLN